MQLVVATGNAHKVTEFQRILADLGYRGDVASANALGGMPEVDEDADSFRGNALLKARALASRAADGSWVVADDSGLCVDPLDGAPGVHSARYAGPDSTDETNVVKLLAALDGVSDDARSARFTCILALIDPAGAEHLFEGRCEGRIARTPAGKQGFGYDPVFIPEGYHETLGELGAAVKDRLSHRFRALQKLSGFLNCAG